MKLNAFATSGTSPTHRIRGAVRSCRCTVSSNSNLAVNRITGRKADGLESSPSVTKTPFEASGNSPTVDLYFENYSSLFLIRPASPSGKTWLKEHIADDAQTLGEAVVCELRFVEDIFRGASADGLVCR